MILVFMGITTFSYSASIKSLEITTVKNEKQFLLSIETTGVGDVQISIRDRSGETVHKEVHASLKSFEKRLDMQAYKNGNYVLEIEDDFILNVRTLMVSDNGVEVDETTSSRYFKPFVRWKNSEKYLDVDWLLNNPSTIEVMIYDNNTKRIHRSYFKNTLQFNQRFDLTPLQEGS